MKHVYFVFIGSTVIVVSALTAIAQQLLSDCQGYGIEALSSSQASEWEQFPISNIWY